MASRLRTTNPSGDAKTTHPIPKGAHLTSAPFAFYKPNVNNSKRAWTQGYSSDSRVQQGLITSFQNNGKTNHILAMYDGTMAYSVGIQKEGDTASHIQNKSIALQLKQPIIYTAPAGSGSTSRKVEITHVLYTAFDSKGTALDIASPGQSLLSQVKSGNVIGEIPVDAARVQVQLGSGLDSFKAAGDGSGTVYSHVHSNDLAEASFYAIEHSERVDGTLVEDPTSGGASDRSVGEIATAAAFSSYFQMPSIMEMQEAILLTGKRSLLNDKPLLPFVEQIAAGSLREFMSLPNGDFYAFYPDYFGGLGKTAYWVIKDIEIMDGRIDLSDDALTTHMFVVGDTLGSPDNPLGYGNIDWIDRINTAGVVNVFNAFMADFVNGPSDMGSSGMGSTKPSLGKKEDAIKFLQKYGARPLVEEMPAIRSPIYETFVAYQRFCFLWAQTFKTTFEFTFMPELYPGGIVEFEEHGLQCYVDRVVHSGSYQSGFKTIAELKAPAATRDANGNPNHPNKSWVHAGMIRAWDAPSPDEVGTPSGAYNEGSK